MNIGAFTNSLKIQTKITIVLAVVVLLCFSGSIWIQFRSTKSQLLAISLEDARLKTAMLSVAIRSGVAAHDGSTIERTLGLSGDPKNYIASVVVLHADGTQLVDFKHPLWRPYALDGRLGELRAIAQSGQVVTREDGKDILVVTPIRNQGNRIIGAFAVAWDLTPQNEAVTNLAKKAFLSALVTIIVLVGGLNTLLWFVAIAPLRTIVGVMNSLSRGHIDIAIPYANRGDEIGDMTAAIRVFQDNADAVQRLERERVEQTARNLATRQQAIVDLSGRFRASVQSSVDAFSGSSGTLTETARSMSDYSARTEGECNAAQDSAEDALTQCQTVSHSASQAAEAIVEIGRRAEKASQVARLAVENTRKSDVAMQSLQEAAVKVRDVVSIIDKIASMTNMLALNASIEAARAGEMGRGFAVVAHEVKDLAQQTSFATGEISGQIGAINEATREAAGAIAAVNRSIGEIGVTASEIAAAVEEHTAVASEVAQSIDRVVAKNTDVTVRTTRVSSAAQKNGEAAKRVLSVAEGFAANAKAMSRDVESFLNSLMQE